MAATILSCHGFAGARGNCPGCNCLSKEVPPAIQQERHRIGNQLMIVSMKYPELAKEFRNIINPENMSHSNCSDECPVCNPKIPK